jgi:hypothetical protein
MARAADVARGWARFCSKSCKAVVQEKRTGQYTALLRGVTRHDDVDDDYDYEGGGFDDYKEVSGNTGHLDGFR